LVLEELLKSGKLDAQQRLLCKRPLSIGSLRLDCSHTRDVTQLDADDAISYSCNSYVADVSLRMNADELVQTFKRAGLDSLTGLIKNELVGRIQSPISQEGVQLAALGERGIEVTPLELLEAFRKLALSRSAAGSSPDQAVFEGLEHAVAYGTAHAAYVDGMKVAGKTGTASSAGSTRTHGLFVGYAPADQPQIAIVVYLPQGRGFDAAALAQPVLAEFSQLRKNCEVLIAIAVAAAGRFSSLGACGRRSGQALLGASSGHTENRSHRGPVALESLLHVRRANRARAVNQQQERHSV
jgi:cell division protein FtsI/penicillin-binding protein 2